MKSGIHDGRGLIINPEDRFEITEKGKKYLRREKQKDSKRNTNKVIKK